MPNAEILLSLTLCTSLILHYGQCAHILDISNHPVTIETNNVDETTPESQTEIPQTNAWVSRKLDTDHKTNDVNKKQKTENELTISDSIFIKQNDHPCNRACKMGEPPMVCKYHFKVEWYTTMSKACYDCPYNKTDCSRYHCIATNGVKRPVLVVNRQMPGPSVEVCLNDEIIVDVENALMEEGTSVHWHGHHQRGTPYMDGVPFVTQCPIHPKSTFTYRYRADTPGSHFWHSHSALQRGDGMFGSLIVRVPPELDPHRDYYDYDLSEHIMVILDWTHSPGISKFVAHHHSDGDNKPESILVNGKGKYVEYEEQGGGVFTTPLEIFNVKRSFRYKFRIVNAGFLNCPIEMSIDNHTLVVVSSDGSDLEPVEADSLVTYAGERFDVIVQMDQPVDNYWIRYRGLMDCDERFTSAIQMAILHYEGAPEDQDPEGEQPTYDNSEREGLQLNSLNSGFQWNGSLSVPEMKALTTKKDPCLKKEADFKYFIAYDFYAMNNPLIHLENHYGFYEANKNSRVYTPQLNHISMKMPPFPLMVEPEAAKLLTYCNSSTVDKNCDKKFCECTHLYTVPLGAVVELILVDKGFTYDANHPFHLHGHSFRVLGMDRLGRNVTVDKVRSLDEKGELRRNFDHPPVKDTITVPDGGYTVLRWHATNPGYWLFHCHIEYHVELGMAIIFKVGEESDFSKLPNNFPRCNLQALPTTSPTSPRTYNYSNYNKSIISEIEFDIDNSLKFFLGANTATTSKSTLPFFTVILLLFRVYSI